MKRHRNRTPRRTALSWLAALTMLTACQQDVYDKGEGKYSLMRADFVEAHANADKRLDYVVTDDGDSLTVGQPLAQRWVSTPDSTYRALLYYNKVGQTAQPLSIAQIPTASVHTPADFSDGIKTDPVTLESAWVSRNRRYLNFSLVLMVGATDQDDAIHHLGVVGDTIVRHADGTSTYHLRLYHDQGHMPEYYSQQAYFSIPVAPYDVDSMRMTMQTYDGLLVRTFCVR